MNNPNTIVAKFGGTSMQDADSMDQVSDIISDMPGRRAVVVSATAGTTDQLINLANTAQNETLWRDSLDAIIQRHQGIMEDLEIDLDLNEVWAEMEAIRTSISETLETTPELMDRIQVIGERISSQILAAHLNHIGIPAQMVDSHDLVVTDDNFGDANVDFAATNPQILERLTPLLQEGITPIITGFNGRTEDGLHTTLGRGGSDYSAAIVAAAVDADELQIWTDVSGIYNADPRHIEEASPLEEVSFDEASELASFGAKVLHPKTIEPARQQDIPVRVLNTFRPEESGTVIRNREVDSLKSVTFREGISVVDLNSTGELNTDDFLRSIFEIFGRYGIEVGIVAPDDSETTISLTVDRYLPEELVSELQDFSTVVASNSRAIISLVGFGISNDSNVLEQLRSSITGPEVFMTPQEASPRNVSFLVSEAEVLSIVRNVFNQSFNTQAHVN